MILYFSGTGNTRYVAESLANLLNEKAVFISDLSPESFEISGNNVIFCFPVYSWGVPPTVMDFIEHMSERVIGDIISSGMDVSMVCTCGDEVAETPEMFIKSATARGLEVKGIWSVIMPNDYVLLPGFSVDSEEIEEKKLKEAPSRIRNIVRHINRREWEIDVARGRNRRLKSRLIYPLFKKFGMNPHKWNVSQECVSCGRCVDACPVGNIRLVSGSPVWGKKCVSCTACYHHCPTHAINYGRVTEGKGQYYCHLHPLKK